MKRLRREISQVTHQLGVEFGEARLAGIVEHKNGGYHDAQKRKPAEKALSKD